MNLFIMSNALNYKTTVLVALRILKFIKLNLKRRGRPHKVYLFLISIKRRVDIAMYVCTCTFLNSFFSVSCRYIDTYIP